MTQDILLNEGRRLVWIADLPGDGDCLAGDGAVWRADFCAAAIARLIGCARGICFAHGKPRRHEREKHRDREKRGVFQSLHLSGPVEIVVGFLPPPLLNGRIPTRYYQFVNTLGRKWRYDDDSLPA